MRSSWDALSQTHVVLAGSAAAPPQGTDKIPSGDCAEERTSLLGSEGGEEGTWFLGKMAFPYYILVGQNCLLTLCEVKYPRIFTFSSSQQVN